MAQLSSSLSSPPFVRIAACAGAIKNHPGAYLRYVIAVRGGQAVQGQALRRVRHNIVLLRHRQALPTLAHLSFWLLPVPLPALPVRTGVRGCRPGKSPYLRSRARP